MKKILLLLPLFLLVFNINTEAIAQQQMQEELDKVYMDKIHQQFIYQVSPQTKALDQFHIDQYKGFQEMMENFQVQNYSDTSWRYNENKLEGDSIYTPGSFYYSFSEDISENAYHSYFQEITMVDEENHYLSRNQISSYSDGRLDSTKILNYQEGQELPYSGTKNIYVKEPTENSTRETIWDSYVANTQTWERQTRTLYYREEGGYDTLTVVYGWDDGEQAEYLRERRRYLLTEQFDLNETKRFHNYEENGQQAIQSWSYQDTSKGEDGRYNYSVYKSLSDDGMTLQRRDSLGYNYNMDDRVSARDYDWEDGEYVLNGAYDTFYSEIAGSQLTDSVIYYDVVFNDETQSYEIDSPITKTVFEYNEDGRQIYIANYNQSSEGNLRVVNEVYHTYDDQGRQTKSVAYSLSDGELKKTYDFEYRYDDQWGRISSIYFYFNADGSISRGNRSETAFEDRDGFEGYKDFEWDIENEKWVSTRVYTRGLNAGESIAQTSDVRNGYYSRSINTNISGKKVAVLNDGPIFLSSADTTLLFYISAWTIDIERPNVEILDLPDGATFNPETRRFHWEVEEPVNTTMTVRAYNERDTAETIVEFVADEITVGNEDVEKPNQFKLAQNYPNPFNPTTKINFELANPADVQLEIFDLLGRKVQTLINTRKTAGEHHVVFDASALSSGIYIYRLRADNFTETRKMMLIK
ncbi:T9SS type A sorting domain-containing protein [Gracilimonas sp.]|uniref:T9SS type A sorting domain-containing protein n=1 Tax=Gracilimonas sp. TaxID=1974203 RepID=UPI00287298F6|nr:T9SS type A sorting domain-containing protein [Gracilimonas sp.]